MIEYVLRESYIIFIKYAFDFTSDIYGYRTSPLSVRDVVFFSLLELRPHTTTVVLLSL